jgi:hypothetical protein
MLEFNPYEWHDHHKAGKPRWRVRPGMHEQRLVLIAQLSELNTAMDKHTTFADVDAWHKLHNAVLDCEETEIR